MNELMKLAIQKAREEGLKHKVEQLEELNILADLLKLEVVGTSDDADSYTKSVIFDCSNDVHIEVTTGDEATPYAWVRAKNGGYEATYRIKHCRGTMRSDGIFCFTFDL